MMRVVADDTHSGKHPTRPMSLGWHQGGDGLAAR